MELRDIYDCILPLNYGNIDFSPDAKEEKARLLNFPMGTLVDDTIRKHFELRRPDSDRIGDLEDTMPEQISPVVLANPDVLKKLEGEQKKSDIMTFADATPSTTTVEVSPKESLKMNIKALGGKADNRRGEARLKKELKKLKNKAR